MRQWIWNALVCFDRFANVLLMGKRDETISARAGLARNNGKMWGCILCQLLNKIDQDHCDKAIKTDRTDAEQALLDERL
jgi:hypothetical protein